MTDEFEKIFGDIAARVSDEHKEILCRDVERFKRKYPDIYNEFTLLRARTYLDSWKRDEHKIDSDSFLV